MRERSLLPLVLALAAGIVSFPVAAMAANGTHPSSQGGTICKGDGPCLILEANCKGTYTDATDAHGTTYGHCSKTAAIAPTSNVKIKAGAQKLKVK